MDHAIRWIADMGEIHRNKKEKFPVLCSWGITKGPKRKKSSRLTMAIKGTKCRRQQELACLRGIIVPSSWDENGKISEVAIDAQQEQRYVPVPAGKNRELAAHCRCYVEVWGIIERRHDDKLYIDIKQYKITRKPGDL